MNFYAEIFDKASVVTQKAHFFSFQHRIKHSLSILILMLPTLMWNYQTMRYRVFN